MARMADSCVTPASEQMTYGAIEDGLSERLADEWGWEEPEDREQARETAGTVIAALVEMSVIFTSDRWDEDCHACEKRIGDHRVDGRCP